jgi:hypothetical protein
MIGIAVSQAAFDAVAAILPGAERDPDDNGERLIWLARVAGSKLAPATA